MAAGWEIKPACELIGYPRASYYRDITTTPKPKPDPVPQSRRYQPAALAESERDRVLELLNADDHADLSVCQAFYRSWDKGQYLCSLSSWYRIARAAGQSGDRRRQATGSPKKIPELVATGPNQVWSWDISKLKGPRRGQYFHLYVITDIYSRLVTGWRLEAFEAGELAAQMITDAIGANGAAPEYLHSDNGAAMTSKPVSILLDKLGVSTSFSRPRVSNDNPYSEALFKTCKYALTYPVEFESLEQAEAWCQWFFYEYNHNHRHSGIGWHTPNNVHHALTNPVDTARREAVEATWRAHPKRFTHKPKPPTMTGRAGINDPYKKTTNLSHTG